MKKQDIVIFGYGSLINIDSLKRTVPYVKDIKIGRVHGYKRVFNLKAKRLFCDNEKTIPAVVLNIEKSEKHHVNGIYFLVCKRGFNELKKREILYTFKKVEIETEEKETLQGYTVISDKEKSTYKYNCKSQEEYMQTCLNGAKKLGEDFYKEFLRTTYIEDKTLEELKIK